MIRDEWVRGPGRVARELPQFFGPGRIQQRPARPANSENPGKTCYR